MTEWPNPAIERTFQKPLRAFWPAGVFADRVQELHTKVFHILIELVERHFFPENYRVT